MLYPFVWCWYFMRQVWCLFRHKDHHSQALFIANFNGVCGHKTILICAVPDCINSGDVVARREADSFIVAVNARADSCYCDEPCKCCDD